MTEREFLATFWQRRPLLIRQAIAGMRAVVAPDQLFEWAARDDVESRIVQRKGSGYSLLHGPFDSMPRAKRNWTLLVQGANLYDASLDALMRRFSFASYARLDDLMISYAVDGGGVGPHIDSYDVFLLQAEGRRRWRISRQRDRRLVEGVPVKLLAKFEPTQEWVLDPGDMLYLPPNVAHDGVAVGTCMTYSIGFRAPGFDELAREFLYDRAERVAPSVRLADPGRPPARNPARLGSAFLAPIEEKLASLTFTRAQVRDFIGRHVSEPKAHVIFEQASPKSIARFGDDARRHGVALDLKSMMFYRGRVFYFNGEAIRLPTRGDESMMRLLADRRRLEPSAVSRCSSALLECFCQWAKAGWLHVDRSAKEK